MLNDPEIDAVYNPVSTYKWRAIPVVNCGCERPSSSPMVYISNGL